MPGKTARRLPPGLGKTQIFPPKPPSSSEGGAWRRLPSPSGFPESKGVGGVIFQPAFPKPRSLLAGDESAFWLTKKKKKKAFLFFYLFFFLDCAQIALLWSLAALMWGLTGRPGTCGGGDGDGDVSPGGCRGPAGASSSAGSRRARWRGSRSHFICEPPSGSFGSLPPVSRLNGKKELGSGPRKLSYSM